MISYDVNCFYLADDFIRDSLPLESRGNEAARRRESHYLAQVIQQAIEDHLEERERLKWRVSVEERARWGEPERGDPA